MKPFTGTITLVVPDQARGSGVLSHKVGCVRKLEEHGPYHAIVFDYDGSINVPLARDDTLTIRRDEDDRATITIRHQVPQ